MSWLWTPKVIYWGPDEPIRYWKPGLLQRILYFLRLMRDPRYDGKDFDWTKVDERGQYK